MDQRIEQRKRRTELLKASRQLSSEGLDRKKHWGTGTKIKEYEDAVKDSINLQPLEEVLDSFSSETVASENIFDNISSQIDFTDLFKAEMVEKLQSIVAETFENGSKRVITTDGDTLSVSFDAEPERLIEQLQAQEIYLKNLSEDAEETVRDTIIEGSEDGKGIGDLKDDIMDNVERMTENRAETIARTEVITASNKGTEAAMDEAGIEEVMVHASIDRQTCDPGSFDWQGYTSCEEWHQEVFKRGDNPSIPSESHPNCRCALLVNTD